MNAAFEDWPWAMPAVQPILTATLPDFHSTEYGRFDLTDNAIPDDLLHDLTFPSSSASLSKPYQVNQSSFDIDEDMFSCLDDFILYPDEPSEELRLFDSPPKPRREDTKAGSQLSPATSFDDSCSSPATSHIDSLASNSPRGQDSIDEDRRKQPKGRRRHNTTVFPCTLCDRICYTSVEARYVLSHVSIALLTPLIHVIDDTTLATSNLSDVLKPWSFHSICNLYLITTHLCRVKQQLRRLRKGIDARKDSPPRMSSNATARASTTASRKLGPRLGSSVQLRDARLLIGFGLGGITCWFM